jgi:hypothetical protein
MAKIIETNEQNGRSLKTATLVNDALLPMAKQEFRRLYSSLGHIFTTGLGTAVVMALFMYIFGDFIGEKLPLINQGIADDAKFYFTLASIIFSAAALSRWIRPLIYENHGWLYSLKMFGQTESHLSYLGTLLSGLLLTLGLTATGLLLNHLFNPLSPSQWAVTIVLVPVSIIYLRVTGPRSVQKKHRAPHSCQNTTEHPLVSWRHTRVLSGNWSGANLRVLAALPILFGTTSLTRHSPVVLAQMCCLIGGIILSWTVPFLIAEDLRATWIERQSAVNHEQWIGAWQKIFQEWTKPIFITTTALCLFSFFVNSATTANPLALVTSPELTSAIGQSLLAGLLAAYPVWLAPAFVMQIDGRHVLTNIVLLTLIGIFTGTAIIAVPVLAPALYFLNREAHRYQGGRFARGSYN